MDQLIRCKNCDQIFLKSPFDRHPQYELGPADPLENFQEIARDDFQDFLIHHHGHQLENLKIVEDSYVSEMAYSEPVKTSFFKASNGREKFVIKKFRGRIDEPLKYQLIPGDYSLTCIAVRIQSEEISRQFERELKPPVSRNKRDAFLRLMGAIAEDVDVNDLERIAEESHHPLEVYYKIDDVHVAYLLRNCRNIFKGQEYLAMEEFIHRHKDDGVLLLKAIYKIQITQTAQTKDRATLPSLSFNKEKALQRK
jgi:hypothetical protein